MVAGLYLHTSNRLETLFTELAEIVGQSLGDIFRPEIVVVQSAGMGRWLSLRLAEAHGICANVRFPFPHKLVSDILRAPLSDAPTMNVFEREVMTWRIMRLLPSLIDAPEFEPVRHYLTTERPELKLFQLASKIADAFDRYLAFRPRMILEWDAGKESHWQAILWRELTNEFPEGHLPALGKKLAEVLRNGNVQLAHLPPRVSIFGISTLPKFYLEIIEAIAAQIEVHLFVMEPTPQWWQHIVSAREEAKILKRQPKRTAEELHLERGNTLLASMGKLGRDFLGLVGDLAPVAHGESFAEPAGLTMLSEVQRDIFQLRDRDKDEAFWTNDKSIQFHSCHSAMREMEVLHDQLLALLESDPSLQPKDIVVMMPEVASYAPFIEAVFDTPEDEKQRIPFTIADRGARAESSVVNTFLAILNLAESRFGASSVLSILESPAVQRRFNLAEVDLETIRVWIDKAAIRWGIDATHREKFDLPAFSQNTWREGLDRLLLGYALPAGGQQLFQGILPIDEIEGGLAETLGDFIEFVTSLFQTASDLEGAHTLEEWQTTLRQIVDRFFAPAAEVERELLQVRRVLDSLGEISRAANFDARVPFDVLVAHLSRVLGDADSGSGFLVGRVTFCALKPMRSIPFQVVCLVGMNDTAYPRKSAAIGFDRIAQHPQPGDRSTRDDDRYLFLEALLSARSVFYLSYVGQSIRDNSPLPPSVLVSELLDYLGDASARDSLVIKHRLQPFNPDYFDRNPALFSYSAENCRASVAAEAARSDPPPFFSQPLAEPEEEWHTVSLADLFRFYRNPAKFFLQNRLAIRLPNEDDMLEEREPFALGNLERYKIEQDLLSKRLAGASLAAQESLVRAGGQFPPGLPGNATYQELRQRVEPFAKKVGPYVAAGFLQPTIVDLPIGDWTLTGRIDGLTKGGLLSYRLTKVKPLDLLRTWICHLALNCSTPTSSRLFAEDAAWIFPPVDESECRKHLGDLLDIYGRGLREPVPFFPKTSLAFAAQKLAPTGNAEPLKKALGEWEGSGWGVDFPERDDPYIALAFRNAPDPLNQSWQELALRIYRPLFTSREEVEE